MSVFRGSHSPETDWAVPLQRGPHPAGAPPEPAGAPPEPAGPALSAESSLPADAAGPVTASHPVDPARSAAAYPDEPEPLAEPDGPPADDPEMRQLRILLIALGAAGLALILSVAAAWIAFYALGHTRSRAAELASDASPGGAQPRTGAGPVPGARPAAGAGPAAEPGPAGSAGPAVGIVVPPVGSSTPTPGTGGKPAASLIYAQEPMQIDVDCGAASMIDLDGPRPRRDAPEQDAELRYENRCGIRGALFGLGPGATAASHVKDPDTDRGGCAESIADRPLEAGDGVPVQKGTVLCVSTAATLALIEVTGLGSDGVASLRATGWTLPSGVARAAGPAASAPAVPPPPPATE